MKGSGTRILTTQFAAAEHQLDCNGVDCPSNITSLATWSSSDTTVCTVNSTTSPGLVTAVAGGSTIITATFTDTTFPLAPSCFCSPVQRVSHSGSSTPIATANVQVSSVTISPTTIHTVSTPKDATVTVQINHQAVSTQQTVNLEVTTFSTNPVTGVSVTYSPGIQTVTIPVGLGGIVTVTASAGPADIGTNATATVVISGSLSGASSGLRIVASSASQSQATLTVQNP